MKAKLFVLVPACLAAAAVLAADSAKWTALFNGRNLDGWEVKGGTAKYEVKDGVIIGTTVEGSANTFLCTKKNYADFVFEAEVLCDKELNSGFQIRSHTYEKDTPQASKQNRIRKAGEVFGYQCEITVQAKGTSGNFWDEGRFTKWHDNLTNRPPALTAFKDGQRNQFRIAAQGDRIRSWVNGVLCADFRDATDKTGFIGLQVHGIKAGTGPFQVRWKNIRVRELKPGEEP